MFRRRSAESGSVVSKADWIEMGEEGGVEIWENGDMGVFKGNSEAVDEKGTGGREPRGRDGEGAGD